MIYIVEYALKTGETGSCRNGDQHETFNFWYSTRSAHNDEVGVVKMDSPWAFGTLNHKLLLKELLAFLLTDSKELR